MEDHHDEEESGGGEGAPGLARPARGLPEEVSQSQASYITPIPILYSRSAALKAKIAAMDLTPRHNTPVMEEVRNIV